MPLVAADEDRIHLRRALRLAGGGRGRVSPNPLVGAVVTREGEVIGEGFHAALGARHAEVAAIEDCRSRGFDPAGSTLYVTLEPCAHQGRQPPCTDAIVAAGIARVVAGCDDPSEKASGRGPGILRDEGIAFEYASGAEASAARRLIQPFRKHARTGKPHLTLKSALTLDGYTATEAGESKWISGPSSRALVHDWRADAGAVAVGIGTVLADDPELTARDGAIDSPRQPLRVVFDSRCRLPAGSRLVETAREVGVLVITTAGADPARREALERAGVEVVAVPADRRRAVEEGLRLLGERGITSVLLEGGATLAGAFIEAGEVDEMRLFFAPVLFGSGRPLAAFGGVAGVGEALRALEIDAERVGEDVLVRALVREW